MCNRTVKINPKKVKKCIMAPLSAQQYNYINMCSFARPVNDANGQSANANVSDVVRTYNYVFSCLRIRG